MAIIKARFMTLFHGLEFLRDVLLRLLNVTPDVAHGPRHYFGEFGKFFRSKEHQCDPRDEQKFGYTNAAEHD